MSKIAKPFQDNEIEDEDGNEVGFEDDSSADETKKANSGFTPTQRVSWPWSKAKPPEEPETKQEAIGRTKSEHVQVNRVLANREEAEKARQDDHRHDPGGSIEAKWASGYTKVAGKHIANPGLLTRGGRAKILPGRTQEEELQLANEIWKLESLYKQILHGRNATIFERHVIEPLVQGTPEPTVKETAAQFGITTKRVYKILDRCWQKISSGPLNQPLFSEEDLARRWRKFQSELEANKLQLKKASQKADAAEADAHLYFYYGGSPSCNKETK